MLLYQWPFIFNVISINEKVATRENDSFCFTGVLLNCSFHQKVFDNLYCNPKTAFYREFKWMTSPENLVLQHFYENVTHQCFPLMCHKCNRNGKKLNVQIRLQKYEIIYSNVK